MFTFSSASDLFKSSSDTTVHALSCEWRSSTTSKSELSVTATWLERPYRNRTHLHELPPGGRMASPSRELTRTALAWQLCPSITSAGWHSRIEPSLWRIVGVNTWAFRSSIKKKNMQLSSSDNSFIANRIFLLMFFLYCDCVLNFHV